MFYTKKRDDRPILFLVALVGAMYVYVGTPHNDNKTLYVSSNTYKNIMGKHLTHL